MSDAFALRQLVERYAFGCDHRDEALLRSVFVDGAVLNVHRPEGTSTMRMYEDIARIPTGLARYDQTFHFVGNHRADVDGDAATGETYCIAHHVTGTDDFVMTIRYEDQYVRTPEGWRMKQRDLRLLWTSNEVVTPS
jgi:hypothetical protein